MAHEGNTRATEQSFTKAHLRPSGKEPSPAELEIRNPKLPQENTKTTKEGKIIGAKSCGRNRLPRLQRKSWRG
jgi:hypothetical protein